MSNQIEMLYIERNSILAGVKFLFKTLQVEIL